MEEAEATMANLAEAGLIKKNESGAFEVVENFEEHSQILDSKKKELAVA